MKRREFIATTALVSLASTLNSKSIENIDNKIWLVLDEVLEIIFPQTDKMPSSKDFGAIKYLKEVSSNDTFDEADKKLIFQGSLDFLDTFPEFLSSNKTQKENFVQSANESSYGQEWLNKVIYYGIEAMLSDPIYGGNTKEIGWKSLNHETGRPQPKRKYAKVV